MRRGTIIAGFLAATALLGMADAATAQSRARAPAVSLADANAAQTNAATPPRRGLRWNDNGRIGLNLNLNQPVGRETEWGDVEAGAYYRLSPRLKFGAAAGLGAPDPDPARAAETDRRALPRIRLESIFKF